MSKSWKRRRREKILEAAPVSEQLEALTDAIDLLLVQAAPDDPSAQKARELRVRIAAVKDSVPKPSVKKPVQKPAKNKKKRGPA